MTLKEFQFNLVDLQEGLMRFAYSLTSDRESAKDLLQETNLKALKYSDSFVNESNFKAWTYTIMKNTFINNYRRTIFQKTFNDLEEQSFSNTQPFSSRADEADSRYSEIEITQCIEQLKDMYRIPFERYICGYKYKEIANELRLNIGTVKSRIFLSRKKLKDLLVR